MASGFTISLSGLQSTLKNLQKQGDSILDDCDEVLAKGADDITKNAKRLAPVGIAGFLRNKISREVKGKLNYEIVSQSEYAAYMEFGTKKKVQIPSGLQSYAAQFKGKGRGDGKEAWKAISAWCKRKGVPKDKWWFIYREIMMNGVKAHPYFFPAVFSERPNIVRGLVKAIKKERKF